MDSYIYASEAIQFDKILSSTYLMRYTSSFIYNYFGYLFVNIVFLMLAFYGVYYSLSRIDLSNTKLFTALLLLSLPSFGVWTSICSKESVGVFYMGIILGYIIDLLENKQRKIRAIEYIAFGLLYIFKIQFFAAILSILLYIKLSYRFNMKVAGQTFLFLLHVGLAILFFYFFRDHFNGLSSIIVEQFNPNSESTRPNTIWLNEYDIFFNAYYGMIIAFWGPTFSEASEKTLHAAVFIESLVIISCFIYFLLKIVLHGKLNVFYFSILTMAIFWLLFAHYPFGVFNPGSAVRYRENFYAFLVVLIFYFDSKLSSRLMK